MNIRANIWPRSAFRAETRDAIHARRGCDNCRQTGYQGRLAIYEICVVTEPLRKLIMQKRDGGELKQCAIAEGMETLASGRLAAGCARQDDDRRSRARHPDRRSDGRDGRKLAELAAVVRVAHAAARAGFGVSPKRISF